MRGYTTTDKISYWLFSDKTPVTKLVLGANLLTFLASLIVGAPVIAGLRYLLFSSAWLQLNPWSVVTYPLVWMSRDLIGLLFAGYWLWMAGGSLERSWGSKRYVWFFFSMAAISALGVYAGARLTGTPFAIGGLWLPLAGITVAFGMLNPEMTILFMFFIPMKLKYLAMISAAGVFVSYTMGANVVVGITALAGCAYTYWYAGGVRFAARPRQPNNRGEVIRIYERPGLLQRLNPFRRMRDRKTEDWLRKQLGESDHKDDDSMGR